MMHGQKNIKLCWKRWPSTGVETCRLPNKDSTAL